MTPEIAAKVDADFVADEREEAADYLRLLEDELHHEENPRILRCVISLAQGDLARLVHFADQARQDWRDVIYWAEYG